MNGDMICLAALDLVLWRFRARVMRIAFVVEIADMNPDDRAADIPNFRIPPNPISNLESFSHLRLPCRDDSSLAIECILRADFHRVKIFEILAEEVRACGLRSCRWSCISPCNSKLATTSRAFPKRIIAAISVTRADAGLSELA
jgi:hypothetical protein